MRRVCVLSTFNLDPTKPDSGVPFSPQLAHPISLELSNNKTQKAWVIQHSLTQILWISNFQASTELLECLGRLSIDEVVSVGELYSWNQDQDSLQLTSKDFTRLSFNHAADRPLWLECDQALLPFSPAELEGFQRNKIQGIAFDEARVARWANALGITFHGYFKCRVFDQDTASPLILSYKSQASEALLRDLQKSLETLCEQSRLQNTQRSVSGKEVSLCRSKFLSTPPNKKRESLYSRIIESMSFSLKETAIKAS